MKRLTLMTVLAAQCIGAQFAHADSTRLAPPTRVTVHFEDLNLAHPAGVAALYKRLRAAVTQACSLPDERSLERGRAFDACFTATLSAAVAKVDEPGLSSYYLAQLDGRRTLSVGASP